jgi:RHS repeat-associated protein
VSNGPDCVRVSPDGSICYVGTSAGTVQISTLSNTVTGSTIDSSHSVTSITTDGTNLYAVDSAGGLVRVINIVAGSSLFGTVTNTITVGTTPSAIALDQNLNRLYVPNSGSNNLSVVSIPSMNVIATVTGFSASGAPASAAVASSGGAVYVGEQGTAKVQIVDPNSLTIVGSLTCNHSGVYSVATSGDLAVVGGLYSNAEADVFTSTNNTLLTYDGAGRCVKIVETGSTPPVTGNATKQFVWCGSARCEERDGSSNVVKQFFGLGEVISGSSYCFDLDHLGSIREVTNSSGTIIYQQSYAPYGQSTTIVNTTPPDFGFASMYVHQRSGLNLTMFRAYSPSLGRWLSRDPMGESMGTNLYGYVGNNPISGVDPLGLYFVIGGNYFEQQKIQSDLRELSYEGLGPVITALDQSPYAIFILPQSGGIGQNNTQAIHAGQPSGSIIQYNPFIRNPKTGQFANCPSRNSLAHELGHASDFSRGIFRSKDRMPVKVLGITVGGEMTPAAEVTPVLYEDVNRFFLRGEGYDVQLRRTYFH